MKQSSLSKGSIIAGVIVLILAGAAYFYYQGSSAPSAGSFLVEDMNGTVVLAEVQVLEQIQTIQIDPSLFSDPAFQALQDYSVIIPPQPVGRPNPFAPI